MSGGCALRLCQCIHFARQRGVLSRRSAAGSGTLAAGQREVHAPCEAETWNGHKRRSAQQTHRFGVLGYKSARRKRHIIVMKPHACKESPLALVFQRRGRSNFYAGTSIAQQPKERPKRPTTVLTYGYTFSRSKVVNFNKSSPTCSQPCIVLIRGSRASPHSGS